MMPGLGNKNGIDIEVTSKPRADYQSTEYGRSGLPMAPAIMIDDEVIVAGKDIGDEEFEAIILRHTGES